MLKAGREADREAGREANPEGLLHLKIIGIFIVTYHKNSAEKQGLDQRIKRPHAWT
jgi:hypothetical protein